MGKSFEQSALRDQGRKPLLSGGSKGMLFFAFLLL